MHSGLNNCVPLNANQTLYGDEDSDSDDDVIDVLSADHCTGEHSYTMQMPSSMVQQVRKAAQRKAVEECPDLSSELQSAYRLVQHLTSPACHKYSAPFITAFDTEQKEYKSYEKVIKTPVWFNKVTEKLKGNSYMSITEVVRDIRLILENCYRFFGPSHSFSKRAMKLETVLEQKLALLPRELREKTSIEATTLDGMDSLTPKGRRARLLRPSTEMSALMTIVKSENAARAREERVKQREERRFEKEVAHQVASDWDRDTFQEELPKIASLWDFPQVCQFLALAQEILNLPEMSMCEAERMFVMPQQSVLLSTVMTCLLVSPHHRSRVSQKGPMPYRIWQDRLNTRLGLWYKTYHSHPQQPTKVLDVYGVEPQFFHVLGETNPLEGKAFHDLEVGQRVCLVKALCDYKLQHHKMVQDHFADQDADGMRERELGEDAEGNSYLYFPCLSERDVRIYRRGKIAPITYCFTLPKKAPPKAPKQPPPLKKGKRKLRGKSAAAEPTPSKVKAREVMITPASSKRPSRLRQVIKPVQRHSYDTPASPPEARRESTPEPEHVEEEDNNENAAEEDVQEEPAPENTSTEVPEPSFEMVVNSVEQLRALIASLEKKEEDAVVATRSRGKQEEKPSPAARLQEKLVGRLRALLSELEPQEARFQQTEATVRLKLYKEWHAFANRTEDQEGSQHEDAWNAWTVHYKDEDNGVSEDSDEDSMAEDGYKEEAPISESAADTPEPVELDENSTVRVLRKRKIIVPNGLLEATGTGDHRNLEVGDFKDEDEEEEEEQQHPMAPIKTYSGRTPCYQPREAAVKPKESEPETCAPPALPANTAVQEVKVIAQSEPEPVLQQEAEVQLSENSQTEITMQEATSCEPIEATVQEGGAPTDTALMPQAEKKTYSRQRSMKINALLRARAISTVAKNQVIKVNSTSPANAVQRVVRHVSGGPKQTIARLVSSSNVTQVKKPDQGKVLHGASRNVHAAPLQNNSTKIKLVPTMDAKGENVFLRVEYSKATTTHQTPRIAAVRPVPPEEPPKKFCGTTPLKYGISSRAMASTAAESYLMKRKQENECPKPAILKSRCNPQQNAGRTFHLPWFKKNGIAVTTAVREVQKCHDKGQKKFFRSKNVGITFSQASPCNPAPQKLTHVVIQRRNAGQGPHTQPQDHVSQCSVTDYKSTAEPDGNVQHVVAQPVLSEQLQDSALQDSADDAATGQESTVQSLFEQNAVAQQDMLDHNVTVQQSIIDQNLLAQQCAIDQDTSLQQSVGENSIFQQGLPQQVGPLPQQVLCSQSDAFLNQNAVMPLQDYSLSGLSDNVIISQNNGSQVMYILPEAQTNSMLINSMASVQPRQTLLHQQQPTIVDPSTFLNIPQPTETPMTISQPSPIEQVHQMPQVDMNSYAMQSPPIAAKEHILQQALESCLIGTGPEMGQDAAMNVLQQVPEPVPQQQQAPVFLLTNDGRLIQIVHSS
ncbi:uncharacterized protein LOC135390801 isoform X2 [Ornithodoros turicata]|uniref:uncharacterized protein LOC135390801 isoform X2 n=1 Tax=Ornithodoros turicata TaxID=34597 RepID=UPI003139D3F4